MNDTNNIPEKYLPIGTVLLLKNGLKKVMIAGFCRKTKTDDKSFDYFGCMYPEGFLTFDKILLFNHDQIQKIYHMGFVNAEERQFKKDLNDILNSKK